MTLGLLLTEHLLLLQRNSTVLVLISSDWLWPIQWC